MALTSLDIQQQRFPVRLRGFDPRAVEEFLAQAAGAFEEVQRENFRLNDDAQKLKSDIVEYKKREGTFKMALLQSQKVIDQMQANARKQADLIVADAQNKAARLLHHSQKRLAQLQEEIVTLKRQRVQIEVEIGSIIECHRRLLTISQEAAQEMDEQDGKLKVLKPQK